MERRVESLGRTESSDDIKEAINIFLQVPKTDNNDKSNKRESSARRLSSKVMSLLTPSVQPLRSVNEARTSMFMRGHQVDFILVYKAKRDMESPFTYEKESRMREIFLENLRREDLRLVSKCFALQKQSKALCYVHIYAPFHVLEKYAEILNFKMPIHVNDIVHIYRNFWYKRLARFLIKPFTVKSVLIPPEEHYFRAPYSRSASCKFLIPGINKFFSQTQRSYIVWEILKRARYDKVGALEFGERSSDDKSIKFSIRGLLEKGVFKAAFPLHDGSYKIAKENMVINTRAALFKLWGNTLHILSAQPFSLIREYFGDRITIYYMWIGHYTQSLIVPAIIGIITQVYGIQTLRKQPVVKDVCENLKNLSMCPQCQMCEESPLGDSCLYTKLNHLTDNLATYLFAFLIAIWSVLYLQLWRRKQSNLAWSWGNEKYEEEYEPQRPEYRSSFYEKVDVVSQRVEGRMKGWQICLRYALSLSGVVFMICLTLSGLVGIIVYRIFISVTLQSVSHTFLTKYATIIASINAAFFQLIFILISGFFYRKLVSLLTNMENHRTQSNYYQSYTVKVYLFEFVNYYCSLFYIAFFKGRFSGPAVQGNKWHTDFMEECDLAQCSLELSIQMGIIMIFQQIAHSLQKIVFPVCLAIVGRKPVLRENENMEDENTDQQWLHDYLLEDLSHRELFDTYLEPVIQFGFVTMFVAAFPLAPLFAWINNMFKVRRDARKMLIHCKRPVASPVSSIGVWQDILEYITTLGVIVNSLVIAFSSDVIPKTVYVLKSGQWSLEGYTEQSLEKLHSEFGSVRNDEPCFYKGPSIFSDGKEWWMILAFRLIFVLAFQYFVFLFAHLIKLIVPEKSHHLLQQIRREQLLSKQATYRIFLHQETLLQQSASKREECSAKNIQVKMPLKFKPTESNVDNDINYSNICARHNTNI